MHNRLGITERIPDDVSYFFDRPFKVMNGEEIASLIANQIVDKDIQQLSQKRLIGNIDQITDNTDFRKMNKWSEGEGECARNVLKKLFKPSLLTKRDQLMEKRKRMGEYTSRKISKKCFEKAKTYIMSEGRVLERARFEFEFENGSRENVITQLRTFQNADGGFGNGLEPDFWLPHSSPMATWAAGQILMEIGADINEPIVGSMIDYLINTNDMETGMWDSVLPENNDYPHAPWWHWQQGVQGKWMFNPSAELAGFLIHWSPEKSEAAELGWNSIQKAVNHLMTKSEMDRHEINNFQQLIKIIKPYEAVFNVRIQYSLNNVSEKIMALAEQCVDKNAEAWTEGYKPLPLDVIDGPDDPLCVRFGSLVEQNLKLYIEQASEEGIWDISWGWTNFPKEFEVAKRYWKGIVAVNRYKQLKAFGYLE